LIVLIYNNGSALLQNELQRQDSNDTEAEIDISEKRERENYL